MANLGELTERIRNYFPFPYPTVQDDVRDLANKWCAQLAIDVPKWWIFESTWTMYTADGIYSYTLPPLFKTDKELYRVTDNKMFPITLVGKGDLIRHVDEHLNTATDRRGFPTAWVYYLSENRFELDPIPDAVYELRFLYMTEPKELTADSDDNVILNDELGLSAVISGILSDLHLYQNAFDAGMVHMQNYERTAQKIRAHNFNKVKGNKAPAYKIQRYGQGRIKGRGR